MRTMNIDHFGGSVEVSEPTELDNVLRLRFDNSSNEFWLCGDEKYPTLAINVRGSAAIVHFFEEDGHVVFISIGDDGAVGDETFYTNGTEEMEISAIHVVEFEQARQAAVEFVRSGSIPTVIDWYEL